MSLIRKIDALVVGAGPVGLVAALTLLRDGHRRVEIIDEAERRTGLSYALALHPEALEVLEGLGVMAALLARGNRLDWVALYDGRRRRGELDLQNVGGLHPFVLVVPQNELEEVLLSALADQGVLVRWRHRLRLIEASDSETVTCAIDRVDPGSTGYAIAKIGGAVGKTFDRKVPMVIGADGHHSLVRRQLGIERRATGRAGTVAVFELEGERLPADCAERDPRRELRITFTERMRSVWWPLPGGRTRLGFELFADESTTATRDKSRLPGIVPWLAHALDEQRLRELVAERLPWHSAPTGRLMWSVAVRFERGLATSFGRGRVWLAGDAAHLAFPFGVHSMNGGIVEAEELATRCGAVLAGSVGLNSLEEYGRERESYWRALAAVTGDGGARVVGDDWLALHAPEIVEALPLAPTDAERLLHQPVLAS